MAFSELSPIYYLIFESGLSFGPDSLQFQISQSPNTCPQQEDVVASCQLRLSSSGTKSYIQSTSCPLTGVVLYKQPQPVLELNWDVAQARVTKPGLTRH